MKKYTFFLFAMFASMPYVGFSQNNNIKKSREKFLAVSQSFLYAVRTGEEIQPYIDTLANADIDLLTAELNQDNHRKAFWLNIYNAFTQVLLSQDKSLYKKRSQFFTSKRFKIAGYNLSLDDMEHGILRRSKIKWSLGHLNKLFTGSFEKRLRVNQLDYRIHFALNCGAKSCPPIAFYTDTAIDTQLDLATRVYLLKEVKYDADKNTVQLPAIMSWFRRDFGGKKKMISLLQNLGIIPNQQNPRVRFMAYNWELHLSNYVQD